MISKLIIILKGVIALAEAMIAVLELIRQYFD
ncbi:DinQ-like type I toxin DqlB [Enterobacter cloacae]|nr:DinQ-like type I toxin DqlB [Enterobacter cloacae]KIF96465.1 membrane protein [Enterobacter cloacae]